MALDEIIAHKREEVALRKERAAKQATAESERPLHRSDRSLEEALRRPHTGFIMECKKASPSRGLIRKDFDVQKIVSAYAPWADAISVLTDERWFQGSLEFLEQARGCTPAPILCKDFIIDPWQIGEARRMGADAVLLMLSVLDDATWRACAATAEELGVDCLTEVHSEDEAERAKALGARIVGINNRNLKTLKTDLSQTERILPHVPEHVVRICESGIATHADVLRFRDDVDAFLVGTSLMREHDVSAAARRLVHGEVKVCGLTRPDDARAAADSGATWGGLIFAAESPRSVDLSRAQEVRAGVGLRFAGVFVNDTVERITRYVDVLRLDAVQLHGDESADDIAALRGALPGDTEIWKALRVRDTISTKGLETVDRLLLDTFHPSQRGGTGARFDWSLLAPLREAGALERVVLSGGLSPENAAEADHAGCGMLDVNSGVESTPGHKDHARLRAFFSALRGADAVPRVKK